MTFTDKQMFEAIEANGDVKLCFEKITNACQELKNKTGCPNVMLIDFLNLLLVSGLIHIEHPYLYVHSNMFNAQ